MRIGYLECFSGISGDMLLGALVDSGVPFSLLEETAAALNVGARLELRKVMRGGLTGTTIDVLTQEQQAEHSHTDERSHVHERGDSGHSHDHEHMHEHHSHDRECQSHEYRDRKHEHTHTSHR